MERIDPEHHDGTSDATPGGEPDRRRPGELGFAAFLLLTSLFLLVSAWGIENPFGPNGLSSPRALPVATTATMAVAATIILARTARLPRDASETFARDILPARALLFVGLLAGYALLLRPVGFLPTSAIFLAVAIRYLERRSWGWTLAVSLGALLAIWLVFRIVFTVLMPAGIVPEAEIIQFFRALAKGAVG
ncbi:tripartite tricarboxylate transporter TctB family protein [Oceanicella actignis]|uniref:tripartite tricarboxylate transporter TctB family protein n=1 Tax=Oceanicella actignis TaxID=1189325 RepID=UPI0011E80C51|nr:tripartite tricarboxylate transporter TctB family protein [Oceanicella actignis]TYO85358.1 tripartite tricarboxylate transporter TctB family protein [Oceanicella actignis]